MKFFSMFWFFSKCASLTNLSTCFTFYPSGEGVPDMLMLLVNLTQKVMKEKLMYMSEVEVENLNCAY